MPAFGGTYTTSNMVTNVQGLAEVRGSARITVTQTGNHLDFTGFSSTVLGSTINYGNFGGTLTGNTFTATGSYGSSGCGTINIASDGFFGGTLMNLHVSLIATGACAQTEIRGEFAR